MSLGGQDFHNYEARKRGSEEAVIRCEQMIAVYVCMCADQEVRKNFAWARYAMFLPAFRVMREGKSCCSPDSLTDYPINLNIGGLKETIQEFFVASPVREQFRIYRRADNDFSLLARQIKRPLCRIA